jgi:hypothetical protein
MGGYGFTFTGMNFYVTKCGNCSFRTEDWEEVGGVCPNCHWVKADVANKIVQEFIRNNSPGYEWQGNSPQVKGAIRLLCKRCQQTVEIENIGSLRMNMNSYTTGMIRAVLDRHSIMCAQKALVSPAIQSPLPSGARKIRLEDES